MMTALGLGAGFGAGLWALAVWLVPPRPSLAAALAPPASRPDSSGLVASLLRFGLPGARVTRDLRMLDRSVTTHVTQKLAFTAGGLALPVVVHVALAFAGVPTGIGFPLAVALILAAVGFLVPDLRVRREAAVLRAGFRRALSAYLDLVWITLAGGAGVTSALDDSAAIGHGWAFTRLGEALDRARLTRTTPWAELGRLGDKLDVTELTELAASISLAGIEGAKIRHSLAAKATALRTHQITAVEADAHSATERMALPVMALFLGYLAFIGYPALIQVLNGL